MAARIQRGISIRPDGVLPTVAFLDRRGRPANGSRRLCKPSSFPPRHILTVFHYQRPPAATLTKPQNSSILSYIRRAPSLALESLKVLLPTAIFFIKFLEWWYSPTSPARALAQTQTGPLIPPPKMIKPHPLGVLGRGKTSIQYGVCPLCNDSLVNATALPSGYVFCYKCIFAEVEVKEKCPVTLLPMRTWMLRKVLV